MKKITVSILTTVLMLSMAFSTSVFAANNQEQSVTAATVVTAADTQVDGVTYRTHIQNEGWAQGWVSDGAMSGSEGKGLRLEGLEVKIDNTKLPAGLGITYQTQIQNEGWAQGWVSDGAMSGSEGKGLRLEAVQIKLTGDNASDYSVRYKTHIQNKGWETAWTYDGGTSGTVGEGLRLEAIEIEIVQNEADLTAYNAALAAVNQADYTVASWTAYQAVVAANVVTTADLQSKVDDATANIIVAQTDLVKLTKITAVSAINPTTAKVTFNQKVTTLDKSQITVTDTNGNKQYIKTATLAADGLSADVVFYNTFVDKTTYNVSIALTSNTATGSFDYIIADVARIVATTPQIVKANTATAIEYKVYDVNGLDVTSLVAANITFPSTVTVTNGSVTLAPNTTGFLTVVYTKGDLVVSSPQVTVSSQTPTVNTLLNYTLDVTGASPDFAATSFVAKTTVNLGDNSQFLYGYAQDQFDTKSTIKSGTPGISFESLDTSIGLVDRNTGNVTPIKEGNLPVRIKVGTINQVIDLQVIAAAKATSLSLDKEAISVSDQITTGQEAKITVKDQFGTKFATNPQLVTATIKTGTDLITMSSTLNGVYANTAIANLDASTGQVSLFVKPVAGKEGTATIELALGTIKTTLTVNVIKAGTVTGYVIEGAVPTLDINGDVADASKIPEKMVLTVFPVDANGVKTGPADTTATYVVKEGTTVKAGTGVATLNGALTLDASLAPNNVLEADKSYTVTAIIGSLAVSTTNFNVVNTTVLPVVSQTSGTVTVDLLSGNSQAVLKAALAKAFTATIDGVAVPANQILVNAYLSDNTSVTGVQPAGTLAIGNATIVIEKINVAGVDVTGPYTISLTVTDTHGVAAATAAVVAAETAPLTQAKVDSAQALVTALPADVAPITTKADLQARIDAVQQDVVDAAAAAIPLTLAANGAVGDVVVPVVPAGYTIVVKTTSDATKYDLDGKLVADGPSNVVYTLTHTVSGLTADTGIVVVTVNVP